MLDYRRLLFSVVCLLAGGWLASCRPHMHEERTADGRLIIDYWEKWTNQERAAMQALVDDYNRRQSTAFVRLFSVSSIETKLLLATAGGNPPDVAGLRTGDLAAYAEQNALLPLDRRMAATGLLAEDYLPNVLRLCRHRGFLWGLPTTPGTLALHYNKRMFREAGLDPERPPRTIAELDAASEKLTQRTPDGSIRQLGFSPYDPSWYIGLYPFFFGARFVDLEHQRILSDERGLLDAAAWLQHFPRQYGLARLQEFNSRTGGFDSAQNAFIAERTAMQFQGVWMANFIHRYNPDMEWGVAPFPTALPGAPEATVIESDLLVIPRGARHPDLAWDFICFMQRPENLERLALAHWKFPPLCNVNPGFWTSHPNPNILLFRRLAECDHAFAMPSMPAMSLFRNELLAAFDRIWLGEPAPTALAQMAAAVQPIYSADERRWSRIGESRAADWSRE